MQALDQGLSTLLTFGFTAGNTKKKKKKSGGVGPEEERLIAMDKREERAGKTP